MKKYCITILALLGLTVKAQAAPLFGYVQIGTGTQVTPTLQQGAINISSAAVQTLNVKYGISAATGSFSGSVSFTSLAVSSLTVTTGTVNGQLSVSSNTVLAGATFYQGGPINMSNTENHLGTVNVSGSLNASNTASLTGPVALGGNGNTVSISSNVIVPGTTFYAGGQNVRSVIGPVTFSSAPFSNWTSYTPNFSAGFGTVSTTSMQWRRVGDTMEIMGYFKTGTVAASISSMTIPSGFSIDTSKVPNVAGVSVYAVGFWWWDSGATWASTNAQGPVFSDGVTTNAIFFCSSPGSNGLNQNNANNVVSSSSGVEVNFKVPIVGWSF